LIRGDTNMPCILLIPAFPFQLTLFGVAVVGQNFETWSPLFEFHFPIENDAGGNNDEMRTPYVHLAGKMRNKSDCLDSFSIMSFGFRRVLPEAHFIGKYPVDIIVI
jgi:hypothetical protein